MSLLVKPNEKLLESLIPDNKKRAAVNVSEVSPEVVDFIVECRAMGISKARLCKIVDYSIDKFDKMIAKEKVAARAAVRHIELANEAEIQYHNMLRKDQH